MEEMDKFSETYQLPKLKKEEIDNLNRLIISKEIASVIKNLPENKSPGLDGFPGDFNQKLKEGEISIFLKIFQKYKKKENLQIYSTRPALS